MEYSSDLETNPQFYSFSLNTSQLFSPNTYILTFGTYQALALQNQQLAQQN